MTAAEIRALAVRAGIGPGVRVLDLCCGIAGPGRFLARGLGCAYLGVDASASAVAIARRRAGDLPCRFAVAHVPPVPAGAFDVVLLLETMLAFADKDALLRGIAAALRPGGRFAFTLEAGRPLTRAERAAMPDADTVSLIPFDDMVRCLERAGLVEIAIVEKDLRRRAVWLTERGARQLAAALPAWRRAQAALAAVVKPRDVRTIATASATLTAADGGGARGERRSPLRGPSTSP